MTLDAPRLPFALDPLIAEARQRMRRRRLLLLAVLVIAAAGLAFALKPWGGPGPARPTHSTLDAQALAHLNVPVGATERQWRHWIRTTDVFTGLPSVDRSRLPALRRAIESHAALSGATVIRIKLWRASERPPLDLVVATATPAAVYLRHHLKELLQGIRSSYMVLDVVDQHAARILEVSYRARTNKLMGSLYVRPGLAGCSPIQSWGSTPPCPVN
jgi:hypothetical protein